jgi:hypothetical protein
VTFKRLWFRGKRSKKLIIMLKKSIRRSTNTMSSQVVTLITRPFSAQAQTPEKSKLLSSRKSSGEPPVVSRNRFSNMTK